MRVLGRLLSCALLPLAIACSGKTDEPPSTRPNVVLIVVDTLRADRLGCYGHPSGFTPRIDQLAASGVRFERARSQAPWTLPSFASLFTSTTPIEHGAGGNLQRFQGLPAGARTLAEVFQNAGYATGEIVNVDFLGPSFGLDQGFWYRDVRFTETNETGRDARATTAAALRWAEGAGGRPFFLLVHYFDCHATYDPPDEFRRLFAAEEDRATDWTFGTRQDFVEIRDRLRQLDPATIRRAERLYDGEVAFVDQEVGRLLDGLQALSRGADTLVVLTADHGEEFLDHGGWEHGHSLYDELLRVPLIFAWPGHVPARVVEGDARLIDVAPTLCELAGIELPPEFGGRSLLSAFESGALEPAPLLALGSFLGDPQRAWLRGGAKVVVDPALGARLFDLTADPSESSDLAASQPQRLSELLSELALAEKALQRRAGAAVELTPEERSRLGALGYFER
jgi:arylsulfatase A-like enzyme